MNRQFIVDELRFWDVFPDERKTGTDADRFEAQTRATIAAMAEPTRSDYREVARRQYAEQEATKASVTGRASHLLLFVGVISTGATVVAASLASAQPAVLVASILVGACLLYSCLAVAFLSVRAQEVSMWSAPIVELEKATDVTALAVEDAMQHTVAFLQNEGGVRHHVAYLAGAQRWARRAVILVVTLGILSVVASATKAPSETPRSGPTASPITTVPRPSTP